MLLLSLLVNCFITLLQYVRGQSALCCQINVYLYVCISCTSPLESRNICFFLSSRNTRRIIVIRILRSSPSKPRLRMNTCAASSPHFTNVSSTRMRCFVSHLFVTGKFQEFSAGYELLRLQWWGLRPSVLEQDRSETKKIGLGLGLAHCGLGMVLVLQVLCCVVKHNLVTLVVLMILEDTAAFQVLFLVSLFCAWNVTTVKINSGVHLLKS